MFDKKTVFIIGAGAGVEINMPVGTQLSHTIADKTYIRHKDFGAELQTGDYAVSNALKRITKARGLDYNAWRAEACAIREGIFETRSIDAYLNTHKENEAVKIAGKLAIVQSILEAEKDCDLFRDNGNWRNNSKVASSWFPELFYIMQDGVGRADDIRKIFSSLTFITFNYDRCLEHYLYHTIMGLYRLDEREAAEIMASLEIFRPYGQVGSLNWEQKGRTKVAFGGSDYREIEALAEEIKTFNEQIEDQVILQHIRGTINAAERIVFLGFHYHKQNMDLMTVSDIAVAPRPAVIANSFDRSGPEVSMIEQRIAKMLGEKRPAKSIEPYSNGCKSLFKHYAATWM
ncbi:MULTISPECIES: hypothetical protein [unclassified Bradyrhizobium]|uniref:hypothetical protein n=1 Tax=unclassified Bradyrhizobium TaxID=2631580 RepID=UPI0024795944|nr:MULTISPECIES: hypothetical protein [unclassified Bradyrhizobium]WGR70202.1 hypothetical protein MTX24_33165 [Bradyrhizobium sp. ISRA426]WGR82259.1 hypothetical protein MTX21_18270 [Bradyrhizobium sp. ISRA430]WGR85445.1 hypothetical protein MTX25_32840 [Bradyrhizobium sp. ISRA432]